MAPLRRETCLYERLRFLWLRSAGLSLRAIAWRSGRSLHTVRRWVSRWEQHGRLRSQVKDKRFCRAVAKHADKNVSQGMTEGNFSVSHKTLLVPCLNNAMESSPYLCRHSLSGLSSCMILFLYATLKQI